MTAHASMTVDNFRTREHLSPAFRRALSVESVEPLSAEGERAAFARVADARRDAWAAILSEPRRAAMAKADPGKRERAAMAAASAALVTHLIATDEDDAHLHAAARLVASHAHAGRDRNSAIVREWTASVAKAIAALTSALQDIERRNLRLLVKIAQRHVSWADAQSLTIDDLVSYGVPGLHTAALRFEPSRGLRFSTYATWWIRHAIGRAIKDLGREIRVPVHTSDLAGKVAATARRLRDAGKPVTDESLADVLKVSPKRIAAVRYEMATVMMAPDSLHAPMRNGFHRNDEEPMCLFDFLQDREAVPADEALDNAEHMAILADLLADLPQREREMVERRFGLGDRERLSNEGHAYNEDLSDIAVTYGLSRERVRQIIEGAVVAMRKAARRRGMVVA